MSMGEFFLRILLLSGPCVTVSFDPVSYAQHNNMVSNQIPEVIRT